MQILTKVQRLQNRRSALDESCGYDKAGIEPHKAEHARKAAARAEACVRAREFLEEPAFFGMWGFFMSILTR
ncbi:MAG: hypothetical protein CEE38_23405 [Planctomycetes bacterium B3_Pla]|nr:MAG: hypothetical protein CEE38_23405 [Planctomycetes bacterium B3_Pla]